MKRVDENGKNRSGGKLSHLTFTERQVHHERGKEDVAATMQRVLSEEAEKLADFYIDERQKQTKDAGAIPDEEPSVKEVLQRKSSDEEPSVKEELQRKSSDKEPPVKEELQRKPSDKESSVKEVLQRKSSDKESPVKEVLQRKSSDEKILDIRMSGKKAAVTEIPDEKRWKAVPVDKRLRQKADKELMTEKISDKGAADKKITAGTWSDEDSQKEEFDDVYYKVMERLVMRGAISEEEVQEHRRLHGKNVTAAQRQEEPEKLAAQQIENTVVDAADGKTETGKEGRKVRKISQNVSKAAVICLIGTLLLFYGAMTSEANRLWLMQTANGTFGNGNLDQVNSDENRKPSLGTEEEAKKKISETLDINVPDFYYRPDGMQYDSAEIDTIIGNACIQYTYDSGWLYLEMTNSIMDMSFGRIKENVDNTRKMNVDMLNESVEVVIEEAIEGENVNVAYWKYKNASYRFGGTIETDELIKILEKISFSMKISAD